MLHLQGQLGQHHDSIFQYKYSLLSQSVGQGWQKLCQGEGCQVPQGMEGCGLSLTGKFGHHCSGLMLHPPCSCDSWEQGVAGGFEGCTGMLQEKSRRKTGEKQLSAGISDGENPPASACPSASSATAGLPSHRLLLTPPPLSARPHRSYFGKLIEITQ